MTIFASLVLVFVLVIRPQEIWPAIEALHPLEVFTALALLGVIVDVALGRQKNLYTPQLPFLLHFLLLQSNQLLRLFVGRWTLESLKFLISLLALRFGRCRP